MTVPTTAANSIASALIVAASDAVARVDRAFFKQARIFAVRHVVSGAEALAAVRRERPSLIFCDATLADMDGRDLVAALRADSELADIPVILAATGGTKAEVLSAVKLGVAGFLLRPYSEDTFRRHLAMAAHMARYAAAERAALARAAAKEAAGDVEGAVRGYEALAEAPDDAPRHFEEGMAALAVRDVERAILAFHRALAANKLYVEAHLGLARAWLVKGSQRRYRHYMKQAANACARVQRFAELRDQFVTLLAADEAGFNPFLALGNELVRDRHYAAAVSLFRLALELAPKNADAYVGLSKAYHFLRRPDLAERAVRKGLSLNERHLEARAIHRRLTGQADTPEIPLADDKGKDASVQLPLLLRGVLYLAGLATETLVRPRRSAKAA